MNPIDTYIFSMIAGFIGYCFNSIEGFLFGVSWAVSVIIILSFFGRTK